MCSPRDPDVFGKPLAPIACELVADEPREVEHLRERQIVGRIEIDRRVIDLSSEPTRENQGSCEIDASCAV